MKKIVKVIKIIIGGLFGKKQNSKEQKNTATTTDDPNRIKKITDLLKIYAQKINDVDVYRISLGRSQAISKKFKTYDEAEKWINKIDGDLMELTMTIAKEVYDIEKDNQRRENIKKVPKPNKA